MEIFLRFIDFLYEVCYYNYVSDFIIVERRKCMKKILHVFVPVLIVMCSLVAVSAASKTKFVSLSCSYGSASENITCAVTLATLNSPKYSYSNQVHNDGIGKRWSGLSHSTKKTISGDTATYTNTPKASWIDYNYVTQSASKNVIFEYKGTLQ